MLLSARVGGVREESRPSSSHPCDANSINTAPPPRRGHMTVAAGKPGIAGGAANSSRSTGVAWGWGGDLGNVAIPNISV